MSNKFKKVKISIPGEKNKLDISQFTGEKNNLIKNVKFYINDDDLEEADAWFILEDPYKQSETCIVPKDNIIYFSAEASYPIGWYDNQNKYSKFFSQFSKVISCHPLIHNNFEFEPPYLPWAINANHGTFYNYHFRDYNYFLSSKLPKKTKLISVICSNQDFTASHKLRLRFVKNLKKHFGQRLDWFGNGINSVNEKWDAIAPYKYTIVLEGQSRDSIITEKIGDAYLGGTYPIYWGAPDIDKYFNNCPRTNINILNFNETVNIIENILKSSEYENSINGINKAKRIVLNDFNFLFRLYNKFKSLKLNSSRSKITLKNRKYFISIHASLLYMMPLNLLGRMIRKIGQNLIDFSISK